MSQKNKFKKYISIIVVCLNSKKETISTIKSIFKQSYRNYEIIVIDGKSLDGTVQYLKKNHLTKEYTFFMEKSLSEIYVRKKCYF